LRWRLALRLWLLVALVALASAQGSGTVLTVFADGTVKVRQERQVDPEDPVATVQLLAADVQRLLATDENNAPLQVEMSGSAATIATLGASHVTLVYETSSLVSADGGVWTLRVNTADNATVLLPANSRLVFVSPQPVRILNSTIQISPGTWEISYNLLQSVGPPQTRSGCLVATAAYGPMSESVRSLRHLREGLLRTQNGNAFLQHFDSWYYSWSPIAAEAIAGGGTPRMGAMVLLEPIITVLAVARNVQSWTEGLSPDVAALLTGILASTGIGAVYLGPIFCAIRRTKELSNAVTVLPWGITVMTSPLSPALSAPLVLTSMLVGGDLTSLVVRRAWGMVRPCRPALSRSPLPPS